MVLDAGHQGDGAVRRVAEHRAGAVLVVVGRVGGHLGLQGAPPGLGRAVALVWLPEHRARGQLGDNCERSALNSEVKTPTRCINWRERGGNYRRGNRRHDDIQTL